MAEVNAKGIGDEVFWEQALKVYNKKLEVIASNIANADTPNYYARDIDFNAAMSEAMAKADGKMAQPGTLPTAPPNQTLFPLLYSPIRLFVTS